MAAVGYGYDEEFDLEYVTIRNTWGTGWGEGGYIRVAIRPNDSADNLSQCGLYGENSYPVL